MREIKFRGWDRVMYPVVDSPVAWLSDPPVGCVYMQYVGLKDKNGKEIYEGDIVRYEGVCSAPNDKFGKKFSELIDVKFNKGCFEPFNIPFMDSTQSEIIGNIYENPELLQK